ncbi:MAG: hypothetical protein AAGI17_03530 [Planctomycetota bacterium]
MPFGSPKNKNTKKPRPVPGKKPPMWSGVLAAMTTATPGVLTLAALMAVLVFGQTLVTHRSPRESARRYTMGTLTESWLDAELEDVIEIGEAILEFASVSWSNRVYTYRAVAWAAEDLAAAETNEKRRAELLKKAENAWRGMLDYLERTWDTPDPPQQDWQQAYWIAFPQRGLGMEAQAMANWQRSIDLVRVAEDAQGQTRRQRFSTLTHALGMMGDAAGSLDALEQSVVEQILPSQVVRHLRHRAFSDLLDNPKFQTIYTLIAIETRGSEEFNNFDSFARSRVIAEDWAFLRDVSVLSLRSSRGRYDELIALAFSLEQSGPISDPKALEIFIGPVESEIVTAQMVWDELHFVLFEATPEQFRRRRSRAEHRYWALSKTGKEEQARDQLRRTLEFLLEDVASAGGIPGPQTGFRIAGIYSLLGDVDSSLRMIARVAGQPDFPRAWALAAPELENARNDPRWSRAISQGLVDF